MRAARVLAATALAVVLGAHPGAQDYASELELPSRLAAEGEAFRVTIRYEIQTDTELEAWRLGPAALRLDGQPAGDRGSNAKLPCAAGSTLTAAFDVGPLLEAGTRRLALDGAAAQEVTVHRPLEGDAPDFMELGVDDLSGYRALFLTTRGGMLFELYPETAPGHVRNFLDLTSTGFYEGIQFHRVSPNFMAQAGCPNTKPGATGPVGAGRGPRLLEAEFSDRNHERGILSMARGPSKDSASSQFFVITRKSSALDGQYSVLGKLVDGDDTLTRISEAKGQVNPTDYTVRPTTPQRILRTFVLPPPVR